MRDGQAPAADVHYRRYLLTVLLIILAFNNVDGVALGLLMQGIKQDLHLTDTQLGTLSGIAFALFYSVMGIPIARWADRGNRVTVVSLAAATWSVLVALCGLAQTFVQLLLLRIAVGVGEAGCIPPSNSLLADYFNREERPRALSIYLLGGPLSMVIGYFGVGWLNELYGWRAAFLMIGVPGLIAAAIARLTLREPRARRSIANGFTAVDDVAFQSTGQSQPKLLEGILALLGNRSFRHLIFCFSIVNFFGVGILQWQPTFFIRSFGLKTVELGTWFALIFGLGGLLGTYWGGALASRLAGGNESLQLKGAACIYCSLGALYALIYCCSNYYVALALMGIGTIVAALTAGPVFATVQTLVPEHMRSVAVSVVYLFGNLVGMGLGPLVSGALSDAYRPVLGDESLRYALLTLCPGYLWAAWHMWRASQFVTQDIELAGPY
jgi:MFS family permease